MNPNYECCTFRGSLVALDAATGRSSGRPTRSRRATPIGTNAERRDAVGSVGWRHLVVADDDDAKRRAVYAATGNMYTEPQQTTSDAVIAFDLDTGAVRWTSQVTPKDVFVVGCNGRRPAPIVRRPTSSGPTSTSATRRCS